MHEGILRWERREFHWQKQGSRLNAKARTHDGNMDISVRSCQNVSFCFWCIFSLPSPLPVDTVFSHLLSAPCSKLFFFCHEMPCNKENFLVVKKKKSHFMVFFCVH